jgi:hypothetical protein
MIGHTATERGFNQSSGGVFEEWSGNFTERIP